MKTTNRPNYGRLVLPQRKSRLAQAVDRDPFTIGFLCGIVFTILPTLAVIILVNP
jgi:hypothetical protein